MEKENIVIKGAKEHNLKDIDLIIPRNALVVITGLSGSGKSSLAFDTIYAEGQRRYVESLSSYARQFLEQLQKPDVEYIEGLSPAISIEQRTAGSNPRSTVGTQTEIHDYLRLLFARIGIPHCPKCKKPIKRQTSQEIVEQILTLPSDTKILILAPLVRGKKGEYRDLFQKIKKEGFIRARVDGKILELEDPIKLDKNRTHTIEVVVDRLLLKEGIKKRLTDSVETALESGSGLVIVTIEHGASSKDVLYNEQYACVDCGISFEELAPRIFSFNSPYGACPSCGGLGNKMEIDPELVISDKSKPVISAVDAWRRGGKGLYLYYRRLLRSLGHRHGFDVETPFKDLSKEIKRIVLYGEGNSPSWGNFEGVIPNLERRFRETESEFIKAEINRYMSVLSCPACKGARLKPESLAVTVEDKNIFEVSNLSIKDLKLFLENIKLTEAEKRIAYQILKEINARLQFMINVGLDYLTLDRRSFTLSGGEAQRIRLATQIGSGLVGVIYILDEPSIGLHQKDNSKLLDTLITLRDLGNTLIVVEHDEATIRKADHIIDLGPGAGEHGGEVIVSGKLQDILSSKESLTGKYLRGELKIKIPKKRRRPEGERRLKIIGAREHNLKDIDVEIPLGLFVCVTGVSGSGKSTLVDDILYRALAKKFYRSKERPGEHKKIEGTQFIDKVIVIDQSPIGRTPRSNPATYTAAFSPIRDIFSRLPESKVRGYKPGRFSFNVKGGRCEACMGDGIKKIEMHFLPDVYVQCEVCKGERFNAQTLEVKYKGRSIADCLDMSVEEALALFVNIPVVKNKMQTLYDVGLGYIKLGQSATTLSGGEAQRIKLATELSKASTGRTFYMLDEPTTGLHFADVDKLLNVLQALVDQGNTVLVIEHNLDVIKTSDYIIDLGPEGGDAGGEIVACGAPEDVVRNKKSYTGQYLKKMLVILVTLITSAALTFAEERAEKYEAHVLLGRSYYNENNTLKALREFDFILNDPTANKFQDEALYWSGEVYLKNGDFKKALEFYDKVINDFPASKYLGYAVYSKGWVYYKLGLLEDAIACFKDVVSKYPYEILSIESQFRIGECEYLLSEYEKCETEFIKFVERYPVSEKTAEAYYLLGEARFYLAKYKDSVLAFDRALAISPEARWAPFAVYRAAEAYYRLGAYEKSMNEFKRALELTDNDFLKTSSLLGLEANYEKMMLFNSAMNICDEIIQKYPAGDLTDDAYYRKTKLLYRETRYREAEEAASLTIEKFPKSEFQDELRYELGWIYVMEGRYEDAISLFGRVGQESSDIKLRSSAICKIGDIYFDKREYGKAMENYSVVLNEYPHSSLTDYAQYQVGNIFLLTGKYDQAGLAYQSILVNFPSTLLRERIVFQLGLTYFKKGDYEHASSEFSGLLKEFPDGKMAPQAELYLADSLYNMGRYNEALTLFKALQDEPSDEDIRMRARYRIGWCYYNTHKDKEAVEAFTKVLKGYPEASLAPDVRFWFGEYYHSKAKYDMAKEYFTSILKDFPSSDIIENVLYQLVLILSKEGKTDEALARIKELDSKFPGSALAKAAYKRVTFWSNLGKIQK